MSIEISPELCYFLGLITGRGKIFPETTKIVINFPATKDTLTGIPFCPICNDEIGVITKKKTTNRNTCKKCLVETDPDYKIEFEYNEKLIPSIKETIFPILKTIIKNEPIITKTKNDVRISINFSQNKILFDSILKLFNPYYNYDNFEIPDIIKTLDNNKIKEFVVGIADSAGFPAWSNWYLDTDGIRTRIYFEFPNNWKLPVQLCNLLQDKFDIHTQTIDWGHPNFRDPKMLEYKNGKKTSGFREHQMKYWADEFDEISYKLEFKKEIFEELSNYNTKVKKQRKKNECLPPGKIQSGNITVNHKAENSEKNPAELHGVHFDRFQQICWKLGCNKCDEFKNNSNSEEIFLTGITDEPNYKNKIEEIENIRKNKKNELKEKWKVIENRLKSKNDRQRQENFRNERNFLEKDTYEPQKIWFQKFLEKEFPDKKIETYIGGDVALTQIPNLNLDELEDFPIRPDIIGVIDGKSLAFIESKITKAKLKEIGQLLSYCIIAKPEIAILCSTVDSEADLSPILEHEALTYGGNQIKCATWNQTKKIKKDIKLEDMKFYA